MKARSISRKVSKVLGLGLAGCLVTAAVSAKAPVGNVFLPTTVPSGTQICSSFAGVASPIARCSNTNYLCYAGTLKPLVGVSADAACHIPLTDVNVCNLTNNKEVIDSIISQGLNKMRLWVAIAGNSPVSSNTNAHPFRFVSGSPSYWRLDTPNETYFANLRNVVEYAKANGIFVEVTFFAPWEGDWSGSPWNNATGKVCADGAGNFYPGDLSCTGAGRSLVNAGFSTQDQFVRPGNDPTNGVRPRQVQRNLIQWTIDRLWCFDNVWWEIANEPENGSVAAATVAQWHADMVQHAFTIDSARVGLSPGLSRTHLIAVQPSNTTIDYISSPPYMSLGLVGLVNGHYTEIFSPQGDMGAINLIRNKGNTAESASKLLGFNETKISAITGNAGTLPAGGAESARAEGWEFMVNRGAAYDHWGYSYSSAAGVAVRTQMKHLKNFISAVLLRQVKKSATDGSTAAPAWVSSLPAWGTYNAGRGARLFWAALDPNGTATTKQYVLYLHNSKRRCQSAGGVDPGCTPLPFNGYNPVITNAAYQETLSLTLAPATYTVQWVRPSNNTVIGSAFTLTYASGACTGTGVIPPCKITSPLYDYDIALKITQQ